MSDITPEEIVHELDKHIVGQQEAKRAVAIALRNRWRRARVDPALRPEITPKNILMIGPTGVGKTEIARRLARLSNAPFIKVEATKFTEVGYVGREVDSIIRDLADSAVKMVREQEMEKVRDVAREAAEERVLDALLPPPRTTGWEEEATPAAVTSGTREKFRDRLRAGELDEREIEIETSGPQLGVEIMAPPGMEEMTSQLQGLFQNLGAGRPAPRFWNRPWSWLVISSMPGGAMISTPSCGPLVSISISRSSSSPARSLSRNFSRVPEVTAAGVASSSQPVVRGGGSRASRTRSSAASRATSRTFSISCSRTILTAESARSRMMESTSRPT